MSIWFGDYAVPTQLASPADYTTWTGQPAPSNITQILRACTTIVLEATAGAGYDVDTAGVATDTQIRSALRDMTCAQAAAWVGLKIDPNLAGTTTATQVTSKRIGSAALQYADADLTAATMARQAAMDGLVPEAARIGRINGLLNFEPYAF